MHTFSSYTLKKIVQIYEKSHVAAIFVLPNIQNFHKKFWFYSKHNFKMIPAWIISRLSLRLTIRPVRKLTLSDTSSKFNPWTLMTSQELVCLNVCWWRHFDVKALGYFNRYHMIVWIEPLRYNMYSNWVLVQLLLFIIVLWFKKCTMKLLTW